MVLESNTLDVLFVKDGQQGEDGKILYTWIKYAKDASGTGITDDPNGAIYIGISYNNESSIESNDPTHYAWTKIQGADGKKGEDAYTIFLENENISFATDKNRNPLSEQAYTSGITIMKGAKPVTDFTIGDIAKTQGIAVAKTDTAIAISVVNGNPLPNDNGEIEIPITVGGTVFKKILTWTCAKKGDQGEKGENGKDGTSVTIINKSITYQLSTSGTVIPKGTWQTSPQTIPEGQYQWTKTSVTYSDGNKTESYSISYHGKNGNDGTSVKTTGTSVKYQVGDSGTTKPTGTWQSNVPTVAQGKYLWTQTIVNYSDGNSTESYSVSYRGIDGSNGVNGMNTATIYLYQRATSTPSKPSNTLTYTFSTTKITGTLNNGWSTTIPTGTDAVYVTVASVSSKNDTATIATSVWSAPVVLAQNGKTGSDGKAGLNVATIYLYQRNTSKPSKPSASVTYTFSTGVASGLNNGWSQKIPNGTNPLYVTLATASSNTATDTILSSEWSDVVVMAQNGEDGQDGISPKVSLLKSGDTTTISIVDATGTHTQTVKDGTNGTPGAAGKDGKTSYFHVKYSNDGGKTFTGNSGEDTGTYMGSYTDYTEADSTDVKKYNWVKVKGDKGDKGDTGQKGQDGTSVKITSKSVTYQTSTSGTIAPTGTWVTTVPTINNGQYLWTKTTVQYSDGNKTEAYSVSYKGTNGTNGTSVTVSKTEVTYQVSTSGTTAPTGTWSTTMPSCDQGQYLWTKTYVKYSDGKDTTSYSVSYKGVDGEKFAFNMLRETNQGSKHWVNMGASGKYSVESITTEDSINAVKLICTEPIASNEWQFCEFSDYEMLKSLKASTAYTLSYDIKTNRSGKISHNIKTGGGQKPFFANDISCKVLGNETWEHVSLKMTSGTTLPNLDRQVIYMFDNALSKVGYSIIKNLKLTEGIVDTPWAPHPEDLEGRGVSETVQYYLATSQTSGVTSSTSGWSTDITTQKLTADKKYLWNCYQTKYSDGTSEPITTPTIIGVYGDKGNGIVASVQRPNKTEFWWSQVGAVGHKDTFDDSSNTRNNCRVGDIFTVMGTSTEGNSHTVYYKSTTDSGDLAGECINHVIAESGADAKNLSITPSSQYFKSTDGGKTFAPNQITITPTIQGEINFGKWQYSIDGGVSFADAVSGQKGLTISNNVLTVNKDSSLYSDAVTMVTFRAVASDSSFYDTCSIAKLYDVSDIGDGRNLLWNSNFAKTDEAINTSTYTTWGLILRGNTYTATIDTSVKHNNFNTLKVIGTKAGENGGQDLIYRIKGLNLDEIKFTETGVKYTLSFYAKASIACNFSARYAYDSYAKDTNVALSADWKRYEIQMHPTTTSYQTSLIFKMDAASTVWFSEFKLEKGSSATGYSTAPEDVQTAILSTKSEISSVSSKVDKNKQAIEQRVEKTTYQQDLNLVKGDISNANEGLNKWRYEIYPKSLFASEYQGKSTMDVFAKNTNLTPSQTVLINDTDLGKNWAYGDNYIAYALTFVKFSAAKSVAITFKHDDGAHLYLNGKLVGGDETCNTGAGQSLTLSFVKGWNCLEVVLNEKSGGEHIGFGTTISTLTECKLMNCYYGTPVARQSHITNQLVQNTTDIEGVSTTVQNVMTTVGDSGNITDFKTNYTKWKQGVNGIESRVGQTYTTKDEFNNLEIGGRNLLLDSYKYTKSTPITKTDSRTDGYIHYKNLITSVELEINQQYIIQAQTDGNWGAKHDLSVQHDPSEKLVTLWLCCDKENVCFDMRKGYAIFTPQYATKYWIRINQYSNDTDSYTVHVWDLKVEKGNKSTGWTPAPEDVSGQITTVQSDYKQLADRFSWVVKSGTSASNMTLTDRMLDVIAQNINLTGKVTFSSFDKSAQDKINGIDQKAGNAASAASAAQSTANNAATAASKAQSTADSANAAASKAQSSIDNLEIGGRNYIYKGRGNEKAGFFRNFNVNTDEGYAELTLTAKKTYTGADLTSGYLILPREYEVGKKVTFSFDIMYTKWDFPDGSKVSEWSIGQRYANAPSGETATGQWQGITRFRMPEPGKNGCELNKWFHFEGTITIPEQASDNVGTQTNMTFYNNTDISATMTFRMKNVKLEYGSKATDFSCSLEETDENINTIQKNVDNISVGGNNLLRHSGNFDDKKYVDYWETNGGGITLDTSTKYLGKSTLKSTVGNGLRSKIWYQVDQNKTYTYSAMVKSDAFFAGINICPLHYWCANNETNSPSTGVTVISYEQAISKTDTWTLLKLTFKPKGKLFRPFIYVGASSAMNLNIAYMKLEEGNKPTDWTPAIEDVSQDATNKASQALTDAKNYSSSAVNWVTNNGSSTTSLNSMVKKWTDGAVSDTAQINGGWIEANTITANKIAVSDFTNYCQLDKDSAPSYGFTATDDEDGIWYTADPIKRDKEISQWFTCEDSQKLYVEYDISTTVQGKVNSSDTDNSYLHSGIMIFAADGNKKAISYIRTKDATAAADGIVTHVSVTETLPTWARFFKVFLQTNGQNGSFSGVLKIRNLQVRKATTGKLIVDGAITADKINVSDLFAKNITASGTIQSNNYAESNGAATAGSKWILSDGSFKSKNLSWDASGNITAAGGKIGKYTITDSYLTTGSGGTCTGIGGNQAFWAGSQSSNEAPFRVSYGGQLVASGATLTNAIVSGDITATKGQIGGWNITSSGLFTNDPIIFEEDQDDGTIEKVFDERFNAKVLYNSSTSSNTFMFDKFCNTFVDTSNVQYDDSDTLYTATSAYSTLIDQGCIDIHESMYCPDVSENHDWNYNYHLILTGNRIEFNEYTLDGMYKYMPDEGLTSIGVSDITTGSFKCDQIQVGGENVTSIIGRSDWIDCDYGNGISNYEDNTWNQVQVRKVNGIVFLRGVMQNSTTWQTHDSIFTFPKEYAPEKESRFVMQGSGSNRWLLVVRTSGICKAERYSNNTTMNNTVPLKSWLNVYASWPAR